jgi:hypothetical protein
MDDALCAQTDPALWHTEPNSGGYGPAKRICGNCPVRTECAAHAQRLEGTVSHSHRYGAWGGQVPRERAGRAKSAAEQRAEDARRKHDRGLGIAEIAAQLDCTERTVHRALAVRQTGEAA